MRSIKLPESEGFMLDKSKIKLFKMDDYMWVAAESAEQANDWYVKEFGEENDLNDVRECPLDMLFLEQEADLTEKEKAMNFEIVERHGRRYARIPFWFTLGQLREISSPFVAGSTE